MLVKLLNWFRGFVLVRLRGTSPERFINLCCNKKIYIWDLKRVEEDYQFYISIKNYRKLRPIAKKTGMVPRIKRRIGFPFLVHRYRKRKGFFLGIIICIVLVYIMSLYLWDISILGGSKYTPEAMLKFLSRNQVHTGILKKKINCQEIEETIRLSYKDIGWVSAEIKGTRLIIKLTETNMPAPAEPAIEPSHMVATKNAIIKEIITRSGTPMVKKGDVIKKGDILVSGILTVKGDFDEIVNLETVVADADIICSSYYDYYDSFSMDYLEKIFSGKKKRGYYLELFGKKLFLYNPSNSYRDYDIIVNDNALHVTDTFYLPFRYGTITTREYGKEKRTYTGEEANAIANARLNRYIKKLSENNVLINENNVKVTIENNTCITQGRILVEEPAWEYKTIQENEWRIEETDEHNGDNH
jgi:similar to stage IV sporulation protein